MNDNDLIRNRLIAYIDRRKQAGGIDYEHIHSFDIGSSTQVDLLTSDIEALTLERAAGPYLRTGVFDRDGREICVGDKIRIDLTSNHTKPEYWKPEYEVVFQPPHFALKHIGGDKDSDTARFRFNVPQPRSTASIETIRTATTPEPAEVTAARVRNIDNMPGILRMQAKQQNAIARKLMMDAADIIESADGIRDVTLIDAQIAIASVGYEKGRQICCGDPRSYAPECCGSPDVYIKVDDAVAALRAIVEARHE